jgi:hypothetical protein
LADINGIPAVVGVFSAFHEETGLMFAPSASQFEAAIRDLIAARKWSCLNGMSVLPPRADVVRPPLHVRKV